MSGRSSSEKPVDTQVETQDKTPCVETFLSWLCHQLKTRYGQFYDWLKKQKYRSDFEKNWEGPNNNMCYVVGWTTLFLVDFVFGFIRGALDALEYIGEKLVKLVEDVLTAIFLLFGGIYYCGNKLHEALTSVIRKLIKCSDACVEFWRETWFLFWGACCKVVARGKTKCCRCCKKSTSLDEKMGHKVNPTAIENVNPTPPENRV